MGAHLDASMSCEWMGRRSSTTASTRPRTLGSSAWSSATKTPTDVGAAFIKKAQCTTDQYIAMEVVTSHVTGAVMGKAFQQYAKTTQSWYTTHTGNKTYFLAYGLARGEKKKTVAALKANLVLDVHPPGK
ncbi:hypothetical protein H257_08884 [Aphanomyces astaci]|uniref:Uncharacterized protein n=1 Tax=Aphanomyces astaci TaxID=112090 RepID=W4GEH5_APHAT|nr:hypothetical protein H257_08884 [Aphanomyces astaci]ETV77474.1 hypothetical protein H257_08884 [Aphanomyces astaci]|eukprot:XP_009833261.1 hypothetical protein H257_08884 [Aphanomyces astaci]